MIEIIKSKYETFTTMYGEKWRETKSCKSLIRLEPQIMKYSYASKEYYISVPWTYFVVYSTKTLCNVGQLGETGRSSFLDIYFSSNLKDDPFLFNAPLSNYSISYLCFSGTSDYRRIEQEPEFARSEFLQNASIDFDPIKTFNDLYSVFMNDKGNNDFRFIEQLSCNPVLLWFYTQLNRKIKNWPQYFLTWQRRGEIPIDFWPSSNTEIDSNYKANNTIESVCSKHDLNEIVCV